MKLVRITTLVLATSMVGLSCATGSPPELAGERVISLYPETNMAAVPLPGAEEPARLEEAAEPNAVNPDVQDSLAEYIRIAVQNNAGLRAAFERWRAAMEEVPQARALPDPQFAWTQYVEEVQTRTGPQDARVTLTQKFPWFGKLKLQGEAAAHQAESLWWEVEAKRLQVVRDVKDAYFEYGYLGQAIRIVQENLALLRGLEPIVQRNIQVGGNQADLIRLQVEVGKLENELAALKDFRGPINARLRAVLNLRGSEWLPWPPLVDDAADVYALDALRDQMNRLNPTLKSLVWQVDKSQTLVRRARRDGYPDFSLGVTYIPTGEAVTATKPSGSGDDPWGFTVGFNIPIDRRKYKAGEREARARQSSARQELHQTQFDLLSQLEYRAYELNDAARQIALYKESLIPRGKQALEVTEVTYQSGKASLLDVIDSQRELLAFERAYWRFVATHEQRIADLELYCGGTLP